MGGATTPIACINTNHNCIGIEIMEDNFLTSLTRVEEKRKEKEFDVVISQ
jgi:DNA modification methylase